MHRIGQKFLLYSHILLNHLLSTHREMVCELLAAFFFTMMFLLLLYSETNGLSVV